MKILYKDLVTPHDMMRFDLLKKMVMDLCENVEFEDLYSAVSETGIEGIFGKTILGGKKF